MTSLMSSIATSPMRRPFSYAAQATTPQASGTGSGGAGAEGTGLGSAMATPSMAASRQLEKSPADLRLAQGGRRVDARRPPRRQPASDERGERHGDGGDHEVGGLAGRDLEEL